MSVEGREYCDGCMHKKKLFYSQNDIRIIVSSRLNTHYHALPPTTTHSHPLKIKKASSVKATGREYYGICMLYTVAIILYMYMARYYNDYSVEEYVQIHTIHRGFKFYTHQSDTTTHPLPPFQDQKTVYITLKQEGGSTTRVHD